MKELAGRTALVPGGRAGTIVAGLTVETHVAAAAAHTHDIFGSLNTPINDAKLRSEAAFEDITLSRGRAVLSLNLQAALLTAHARPKKVARTAPFLAGLNGRDVTGQTIHVNGGVFLP